MLTQSPITTLHEALEQAGISPQQKHGIHGCSRHILQAANDIQAGNHTTPATDIMCTYLHTQVQNLCAPPLNAGQSTIGFIYNRLYAHAVAEHMASATYLLNTAQFALLTRAAILGHAATNDRLCFLLSDQTDTLKHNAQHMHRNAFSILKHVPASFAHPYQAKSLLDITHALINTPTTLPNDLTQTHLIAAYPQVIEALQRAYCSNKASILHELRIDTAFYAHMHTQPPQARTHLLSQNTLATTLALKQARLNHIDTHALPLCEALTHNTPKPAQQQPRCAIN